MNKKKEGLTPREMRLKMAEESVKENPIQDEKKTREEFKQYFVKLKRKLGLKPDLENIIWLHFKAAGFDKKEKFDSGVEHFGYKIK